MLYFGSALHDLVFVAMAAVICLLSSWATFRAIVKDAPSVRRTISIVVLTGLGVWSTHFVAILGLRPDFPIAYSIPETMGSMVLAIVVIGGGLAAAAASKRQGIALLFGAIAGCGTSVMHHLGMYGLSGCIIRFDTFGVIASTLASIGFSMFAVAVSRSSLRYKVIKASLLFVVAVVTLHFGSIIGTSLEVGDTAPWVMTGLLLAACQLVAVLVLLAPVSMIIRQQIAKNREASLSGQVAMATGEGIVTMDTTGRLTWANDAFLRMTGLGRHEIQNVNSVKVVESLASLEDADTFRRAIETGGKATIDVRIDRRGKQENWQRVRLIPRWSESGVLVGFVSAHQDITPEKAALERLKTSEAEASRLAIVAEHTIDSIAIMDEVGRTTWVNASFERMTGYSLDEVRGRRPGVFLECKETNPATVLAIAEAIRTCSPIRTEILNVRKDGTTFWNELEVSPVIRDGKPLRFITVSRDVSERIEREERLKEARQKAEAADQMKSEFLARMSHEIRTPMNGVTGLTEVLSTTDLNEDQAGYVAIMRQCSAQLLDMVNDILDFSSISRGEIALISERFDLRDLAEEAISEVRLAAKEKDLALHLDIDVGPCSQLCGDRDRLSQVLSNLLSNAVKFTEKGSVRLGISSKQEVVEGLVVGMRLWFSVSDTGIGIPAEMQDHVFEPFRQVEESANRSYEGAGLGLAIAKDIVTAMGGRITVASEVGRGATFAFSVCLEMADQLTSDNAVA